jgi:3-oxoacyl-ACP reductase-like protein
VPSTAATTTSTTTSTTSADAATSTNAATTTSSTAGTARSRPTPRLPRTRDEVFAASTVVLALVALLLTVTEHYDLGAVASLAAVLLGGSSQLLSETRFERWESVCATVLAGVLLAVCLANGSGVFTTTAVLDA